MSQLRYWQSINRALIEEMERDPAVVLLGEDVASPGGAFGATRGVLDRFGADRVRDTPISELALAGLGVGAAMTGLRPVVEVMFDDFLTLAMDQIVNQAAKLRFMTGGRAKVPLVIRTIVGAGRNTGPQHSQSLEAWFAHVPGLKVAVPATPQDARGLLKSAIRDDGPVLVFESLRLWSVRGEVDDSPDVVVPLGSAAVRRPGADLTLVAYGAALTRAERACEIAAESGLDVELIDLRTVQPLDYGTLRASLQKTGRLVVVHDAVKFLGVGAEVAAWAAEECFSSLRAPIQRVAAPLSPVPFAPELEEEYFPSAETILEACRRAVSS